MTSPAELARLAARSLRYFVYTRPHGGFGGDWDTLDAEAQFADAGALTAALAALTPTLQAHGVDVRVDAAGNTLWLLGALYVTKQRIAELAEVERWLDEVGVPMVQAHRG